MQRCQGACLLCQEPLDEGPRLALLVGCTPGGHGHCWSLALAPGCIGRLSRSAVRFAGLGLCRSWFMKS